jgi:diaminopimelate epimerase
VENKVAIKFKEGILNIVLNEKNNIFMTGPVSEIKNIKVEI